MYIIYRDQEANYNNGATVQRNITKDNFQFDTEGSGVWLDQGEVVDFIPMHMVLKVVLDKEFYLD